jgi:prepilin-type N-terminal cleavage/methylation domain-containing protein
MIKPRNRGFTLVEILVVIAILAVLAGTTAVMAPKIMRKGKQAKSVESMKQMVTLMNAHANDHGGRLPAPMTLAADNDAGRDALWHVVLQNEVTGGDLSLYLNDRWWKENDSIFLNPLHPKKDIKVSSVGYAMNAALGSNIARARGEELGIDESKTTGINLNAVREPEQSPIVVPHWDWFYVLNSGEANNKRFKDYVVNDRIPVLFLDGHIETMTPEEYSKRDLHQMPKPTN